MGLTIGNYIGIGKNSGKSWSSFWATRTPSGLTAITVSDTQIDLACYVASGIDGLSWERREIGGVFAVVGTSTPDEGVFSDTISSVVIYEYRVRAYKGSNYSPYSDIATAYPAGLRVSSANSSELISDDVNEFYFSVAGTDQPFSVLAVVKSSSINTTNTLLSRGDANGTSYYLRLNSSLAKPDFVIAGSDLTNNNLLYLSIANSITLGNTYRMVYTYSGSKAANGMKIYINGTLGSILTNQKYGTYNAMNNRAGVYVGRQIKDSEQGHFDIYGLLICNKELSQTEVTEFQNLGDISMATLLSFASNIKAMKIYNGVLSDQVGTHNGTSVAPIYFNKNKYITNSFDFLPARTESTFQSTFKNFKLGWFICYGMETYNGDEFNSKTSDTSAPTVFTAPATIDVHSWATKAAESGKIDYAILTVNHIYGFSLYDHKFAKYEGTQIDVGSGVIVPTYMKYDVGVTNSDKNIVPKFVTEFNAVNIKPILYYCLGYERNWFGKYFVVDKYGDSNYQYDHYQLYLIQRLQELARLKPFAFWIDMPIHHVAADLKNIYNAIKSVDPTIGIIFNSGNNHDKINNGYFPFDGASCEESFQPALPSDTWWGLTQSYSSITYPVSKELVVASRKNGGTNYWFYSSSPIALRTLAALQGEYDYAKAAGVPVAISINPKLDGIIDEDQADLIASIVL